MHHIISQMKTPTWCNTVQVLFLHGHSTCFRRKRPSSGVFKTSTAATGTCVIVAGKSSHLLIRAVPALIRRCDDWPTTITHVPVAAVLVLNTPDDERLRPKYVEWPCRNKTCTVLHQVGVFIWLTLAISSKIIWKLSSARTYTHKHINWQLRKWIQFHRYFGCKTDRNIT